MIPMKWEDFCDEGAKQYIKELEQKLDKLGLLDTDWEDEYHERFNR